MWRAGASRCRRRLGLTARRRCAWLYPRYLLLPCFVLAVFASRYGVAVRRLVVAGGSCTVPSSSWDDNASLVCRGTAGQLGRTHATGSCTVLSSRRRQGAGVLRSGLKVGGGRVQIVAGAGTVPWCSRALAQGVACDSPDIWGRDRAPVVVQVRVSPHCPGVCDAEAAKVLLRSVIVRSWPVATTPARKTMKSLRAIKMMGQRKWSLMKTRAAQSQVKALRRRGNPQEAMRSRARVGCL